MQNLLQTKYKKPEVPVICIPRQRLFSLLDRGSHSRLTLISAPAGFGKTTLLSAWINQVDIPCAWLTLDVYDNDPHHFLSYVVNSLQSIEIQIDYHPDAGLTWSTENLDNLLISLINQIANSPRRFVFILDDYHLIQKPEIHGIIDYLLKYLPENMRLIISSRADPLLKLSQYRAKGQLLEIRAEDLRFTDHESGIFLNTNTGLGLDLSDISTLTAKTEGWIAGLQLAAVSLERHPDQRAFVKDFAGNNRYIADYLVDEALDQQPPHIYTFLLQTSILEQLNDSLCDAVTGRNDSHDILIQLERANLFLTPLDTKRQWYRYHQLFKDLLRVRLIHKLRESIPNLYRQAVRWYENAGFISEAVKCGLQAHDIDQVEHLLERHLLTVINSSEILVLRELIAHFPSQDRETNPWLALGHAWILAISGALNQVPPILDTVECLICDYPQDKQRKLKGRIYALRSYISQARVNLEESAQYALTALELLPDDNLSMRSFMSLVLGNSYLYMGDLAKAIPFHNDALEKSIAAGDTYLTTMILTRLGSLHRFMAQLDRAESTISRALEIINSSKLQTGSHLFISGYAKLRLSTIYYLRNELDKALRILQDCFDNVLRWGSYDNISRAYFYRAEIYLALGNSSTAIEILEEFKTKYPYKNRNQYNIADYLEARVYILTGKVKQASDWAKKNVVNTSTVIVFDEIPRYLVLALYYVVQNDYSPAATLLDKLSILSSKSGAALFEIEVYLLMALFQLSIQDIKKAKYFVLKALGLAEPGGCVRLFLDYHEYIAPLLYSTLMDGLHVSFCNEIISQFPDRNVTSHLKSQDILSPLSKREIEVLQLLSTGLSNQEIAVELYVSLYTVKSHARNIYSKLGVANRTKAAAKARLVGII